MYQLSHNFAFNAGSVQKGSHHADDLALVFDSEHLADWGTTIFSKLNKTTLAPSEEDLADAFNSILYSFAKSG